MKILLSIALTLTTLIAVQAKKYDLALNLEKGTTYVQNMHADMTITQSFNGNDMAIKMVIDGVIEYKVLDVEESIFNLEVKYTKLGMLMDMPQAKMEFSSGQTVTDTVNNMISLMFDKIVGKSFTLKLDRKGLVKEITGMDEIFASMFEDLPTISEEQQKQLSEQIKQSFGEESFKTSMEAGTAIFPEANVKIGESWTKETNISSSVEIDMTTVYTLDEVTDEYYVISAVGDMVSSGNGEFAEKNGMLMKQELNGASTAEIKLNKKTGWIAISKTTQDMSGKSLMKKTVDGEVMTIPLSLVGVTTITNQK